MAYERPPAPPMDLAAAQVALTRQAASVAAPRAPFEPLPDLSSRVVKPSRTGFPAVVRQTILDRDNYGCWRCGADGTVTGINLQHRDNRGQGGTSDPRVNWPSNGIVLCGSGTTGCHGWTEANPTEAEKAGWAVQSWADPETVPVLHHQLGWMLLDVRGARWLTAAPLHGDAHADAGVRRKLAL